MLPESGVAGSPQDWLQFARADLAMAAGPLPEGGLHELLCFHAQQAAEKSIKAVLLCSGRPFGRTYSIERLVDLLPESMARPPELIEAARLTSYAVMSRYPGLAERTTEEDTREAVRLAGAVVKWAGETIAREGG